MFQITTSSPEPIYRQIIEQVRRLIASGQLRAGDDMPSVREVAQSLAVNPMTVSKAYSLMEAEGLLERRRGKGMVVSQSQQPTCDLASRLALLQPALSAAAQQAHELEFTTEQALTAFRNALEKAQ